MIGKTSDTTPPLLSASERVVEIAVSLENRTAALVDFVKGRLTPVIVPSKLVEMEAQVNCDINISDLPPLFADLIMHLYHVENAVKDIEYLINSVGITNVYTS